MSTACPACTGTPTGSDAFDAAIANVTLSVPEMHCAVCMSTVEHTLNSLPGVSGARVNLTLRRVSAHADVPLDTLMQALKGAGFEAYPFDLSVLEGQSDPVGRNLLVRLGVAGFAMMNVMLLSVAVWSGAEDATRDMLHLISAAIALPAATFSAQPFFVSAWGALRAGRLNMDVPISLAIILAAVMSLFEALNGGHHAYFDAALSLTFFLLIGRYLEHRTKRTARSAAGDLGALEVHTAERWHGTKLETVRISALAVGDLVHVSAGGRVPADGTLTTGEAMTHRAFLTGESAPVAHDAGAMLRAGEINVGAPFSILVRAVGEDTTLRQIARLVENAENARNRYTALADRAARIYAPAVHLLAVAAFLGWFIGTGDARVSLNVAIAVLIITCPCALGLAVPAVSTAAIGRLYELGFLVKSGAAIERLSEIDTVIFDKTGTLTKPEPGLEIGAFDQEARRVAKALSQRSAHPVARALNAALRDEAAVGLRHVLEEEGRGVTATCGDIPVGLGRADWLGGTGRGTVLKVGERLYPISFADQLRDGVPEAVDALFYDGFDLQMLSGDTAQKAATLASDLGIDTVRAELSPQDKVSVIADLTAQGAKACMIGDGINDAAALASAHTSVAPGSALDAARNAADVVIVCDSVETLPQLFRISRKAVALSRQNFAIAAAYNLIAIPIALAGFATPLLAALAMSLSSLTVLINALRARI